VGVVRALDFPFFAAYEPPNFFEEKVLVEKKVLSFFFAG